MTFTHEHVRHYSHTPSFLIYSFVCFLLLLIFLFVSPLSLSFFMLFSFPLFLFSIYLNHALFFWFFPLSSLSIFFPLSFLYFPPLLSYLFFIFIISIPVLTLSPFLPFPLLALYRFLLSSLSPFLLLFLPFLLLSLPLHNHKHFFIFSQYFVLPLNVFQHLFSLSFLILFDYFFHYSFFLHSQLIPCFFLDYYFLIILKNF